MVAPKKAKLEEAETELKITMQILNDKRAQLKAVQDKLAKLRADFADMVANKEKLEAQVGTVSRCRIREKQSECARERQRQSQRETETDRQRETVREGQTEREREIDRERERDRQRE